MNRRQLYRLLERAQLTHPDGRPFGVSALVRYTRIAEYTRVQAVEIDRDRGGYGAAGVLSLMLEQYPALTGWLLLKVGQRKLLLVQKNTDSGLRTRLQGLRVLHDEFLGQCRTIELNAGGLPIQYIRPRDTLPFAAREGRVVASLRHSSAVGRRCASEGLATHERCGCPRSEPPVSGGRIRWPPGLSR
ncbi:hypothetical protein [Paraburkholderia hospita]|uniref:hypothetical protein n=1 Tax=Paraburkholderia hospita TaxID=169430 RepID=UPI00103E11E5|nr:hypothetical protein [Paraburkholderia hospita]